MTAMALILVMPLFAVTLTANAQSTLQDNLTGADSGMDTLKTETGLGDKSPKAIVASVIKILLGFLGMISVIIILWGGFKWMTAGGNEDGVTEAKKIITAGIIGLVIILAAYGIATFVINQLLTATT